MERKYLFKDGAVVNRTTGVAIPDDEPVFLLRAKDSYALRTIVAYARDCRNLNHVFLAGLEVVMEDFRNFEKEHTDKMKRPD